MLSLLRDLGIPAEAKVISDATAALGIVQRRGLGKLRHVSTNYFWAQRKASDKSVTYKTTLGSENQAELMTTYLGYGGVVKHTQAMGG